ncbi:MAG: penicillin-binding protein beta-lactamase class [Microbacteriaceae bacterium]|nr:penicillin-binding protein beta-lactamase class [Microbacteriaceae bacterium]
MGGTLVCLTVELNGLVVVKRSGSLPRSTPEEQGVRSSAIVSLLDDLEQVTGDMHSIMVLRHGQVIAEGAWQPYRLQHRQLLFSLSKSFTSTAVGFAIHEGLFGLDDSVLTLLPEDAPEQISDNLAAMTVRHLLTMTAGHASDALGSLGRSGVTNWAQAVMSEPVVNEPGSLFMYNSGASYLLSAIVTRATGLGLLDYLRPRLFDPLGIDDPSWEKSPQGIEAGGWGLSVTTEQLAKFGQLYLDGGRWNGAQVIPLEWVDAATSLQVPTDAWNGTVDWRQGYGFQFWRCQNGAFRGDGAHGQFCVVIPEHNTVVVITSAVPDMQAVLDAIWAQLLPALSTSGPLPAAPADELSELQSRLSALAVRLPAYAGMSQNAARYIDRDYRFAENDGGLVSARLEQREDATAITITDADGEHRIIARSDAWLPQPDGVVDNSPSANAAAAGWVDDSTFAATVLFYETPFAHTLEFAFDDQVDGIVEFSITQNVSLGKTNLVQLTGRAV